MKELAFILLFISATSFLVYEKIPYNSYARKVRQELKEIVALHSLEEAEFPDYSYKKDSNTYILSSVTSKAVFSNFNMLIESVSKDTGVFSLNWEPKEGETKYISPYHSIYRAEISQDRNSFKASLYEIEFELEVSKFQFSKSWELNSVDKFYEPTGVVDNTYIAFKVRKIDVDCPFDEALILEVINAFLQEKQKEMNEIFTNNGVIAYYKSLPMAELFQKLYTQTSSSIMNENNIELTLESIPDFSDDTNVIFQRYGKLNDLDISGDPIFEDTTTQQKFNINTKLIQNLINHNLFDISYEQTNNPSPQYILTVEYLKKIMDVKDYEDTVELKVSAKMDNINFNEDNPLQGNVDFTVEIIEKEKFNTLLTFALNIEFKFTPTLLHNGLNFVLLAKHLKINTIKPTETIKDEELLKAWVENTYLLALSKNEYNLLGFSFDLSYYFSTNKLSYEFKDNYLSIIKQ